MSQVRKVSFAAGIVSPEFQGRVDQVRVQTGVDTLRNFIGLKSGGVANRPGTEFKGTLFDPRYPVRTRQWVFNRDQTYQLEFLDQRLAFWLDGEPILEASKNITGVTAASPAVMSVTSHGFSAGDKVYVSGIVGMTELNNRYFIVGSPTTHTFTLLWAGDGTVYGTALDSTAFTAWSSGGTVERVYTVTTPYVTADLDLLEFAQSADVMVIFHSSYAPRKLVRTGHTSWTLSVPSYGPSTAFPTGGTATAGLAGSNTFAYMVCAVDEATGIESYSGSAHTKTISSITKASPAVVTTSTTHGYVTGDEVIFNTVSGMTELSNRRFKISTTGTAVSNAPIPIQSITQAGPMVVTSAGHGLSDGDTVTFAVAGMTELNQLTLGTVTGSGAGTFQVYYNGTTTPIDSTGFGAFTSGTFTKQLPINGSTTTFTLVGEDSTSYGTFTSGSVYLSHINLSSASDPTTATPNVIVTDAAARAGIRYNIYKQFGGVFGYLGSTYALTFSDTGITPDTLSSVPIYREPFQTSSGYPACGTFYQQRLITGGSQGAPNGVEAGVTGDTFNFSIHSPSQDNDAISFQTAGYIDQIKSFAALDRLIIMTSGGEFICSGGGEGNALTPTEVNIKPRTYNGSGDLFPLLIDENIIYMQERGQVVRDLHYSFQSDGYKGDDRSLFANGLFKGYTILDWGYQRVPFSIVWFVRSDGILLGMTYLPDQELYSFQKHDLYGGTVENVCVVPEGEDDTAEDSVYFVVARELEDGSTTRYMERLSSRTFTDSKDAKFLDSSLSYDGTGTGTVTLTGSGWTNATSLTLTFSVAQTRATVGNEVQVNGLDDDGEAVQIRCRIVGVTSTTIVTVIPNTTVPTSMRASAVSDWAMAVDEFSGLEHLEDQYVSVYGDGTVAASALSPVYDNRYLVTNGTITLLGEARFAIVHIGLPITSDIWTLDADQYENPGAFAKKKDVAAVSVRVAESKSFWIGTKPPTDDDENPVEGLYEPKIRADEPYSEPTAPYTGTVVVRTKSTWNLTGRVFMRVMEPSAVTITAVMASGYIQEG